MHWETFPLIPERVYVGLVISTKQLIVGFFLFYEFLLQIHIIFSLCYFQLCLNIGVSLKNNLIFNYDFALV